MPCLCQAYGYRRIVCKEEVRVVLDRDQFAVLVVRDREYGIEIDEFDTDEFLEVLCKAAKSLDVRGQLYDYDEEEYSFISEAGMSYYINAKNIERFNEDEEYGNDSEKDDEDDEE